MKPWDVKASKGFTHDPEQIPWAAGLTYRNRVVLAAGI